MPPLFPRLHSTPPPVLAFFYYGSHYLAHWFGKMIVVRCSNILSCNNNIRNRIAIVCQMKSVRCLLAIVLSALSVITVTDGANILGVFPINGRSHWVVYDSVMKALVARGHNVTVITSFPQKMPIANYTEIDVSETFPSVVNQFTVDMVLGLMSNVFITQQFVANLQLNLCRKGQKLPQVRALLESDVKFDAVR